ncbi:dihydrolipoyl dehydrogenase family protein [Kineococcus terrestris]|uniref:dihydrolipoyl dehydrogenase family protein n=1 Tax=Kineococcus terrestris TaxID=2044856 RepID=UPI0034DB77C9
MKLAGVDSDVVVIGTGSGGKIAALELARAGRSVVAVEDGLVGGYCPYLACVPAKSLLLSARAHLPWTAAVAVRDEAASGRDDSAAAAELTGEGIRVVRGRARLAGPGRVVVGADVLTAPAVVVGTGSTPVRPDVEGLDEVPTWTSEQMLAAPELPARLLVLGGGAVACESAQAYRGLGSRVVLVQRSPTLLAREPRAVGECLAAALRADGVDVRTGVTLARVRPDGDGGLAELSDGTTVGFDRLLLATGRAPATRGLGVEEAGGRLGEDGRVLVDARCRAAPGLYAVGDVNGIATYTHAANHQARVVAADLLGRGYDADHSAVPRAVYTDPTVFSVGDVSGGEGTVSASFGVGDVARARLVRLSRPAEVTGHVVVFADAATGVLVGASCVGPDADSWGAELALAVRARLDVELLTRHVRAFPTWSEAVYPAVCSLHEQLSR